MSRFPKSKSHENVAAWLLILLGVCLAVVFSVVASARQLTGLESTLLQGAGLVSSLVGSFVFGRNSARLQAMEMVKPHARSAFRRVLALYFGLLRVADAVTRGRSLDAEDEKSRAARSYLRVIEAIVVEQIATVSDALEDWRDIVPEDVEELEARLKARNAEMSEGDVE